MLLHLQSDSETDWILSYRAIKFVSGVRMSRQILFAEAEGLHLVS